MEDLLTIHDASVTVVSEWVPVEVYQISRPLRESAGEIDGDGIPGDIATISGVPAMPHLTARFVNEASGCTMRWPISVTYQRQGVTNTNGIFNPCYYPN
jgi:hypothetical protein